MPTSFWENSNETDFSVIDKGNVTKNSESNNLSRHFLRVLLQSEKKYSY